MSNVSVPPNRNVTPPSTFGNGSEVAEKFWLTPVLARTLASEPGAVANLPKLAPFTMLNALGKGGCCCKRKRLLELGLVATTKGGKLANPPGLLAKPAAPRIPGINVTFVSARPEIKAMELAGPVVAIYLENGPMIRSWGVGTFGIMVVVSKVT